MSVSTDEAPFVAAILETPSSEAALLVYADWLEDRGDPRAAYLRHQLEYRRARTEEVRRRLIATYPHEHLAWAAMLEQAGAVEANLTSCEFAWWGTGIGPAREAGGTYECFGYQDQPPLPVASLDGSFAWLRESEPQYPWTTGPQWKDFCQKQRQRGYFVPREFERFLTDTDLPTRIRSCTDNYFVDPPDPASGDWPPSAEREDGLLVTFYADSQACVVWSILLPREPGRYAPILAGPPEVLFPNVQGANLDAADDADRPVLAASQFEQFVFRWWLENEIWFATIWGESRRPLKPLEQAYLDHLNGRSPEQ